MSMSEAKHKEKHPAPSANGPGLPSPTPARSSWALCNSWQLSLYRHTHSQPADIVSIMLESQNIISH